MKKSAAVKAPFIERLMQWIADYRLPLAAALMAGALALGFIGYFKYFSVGPEPASFWDISFYSFRLLNPASTPQPGPLNIEIQIARVLAVVAGLYIAFEALLSIFRDQVQALRVRQVKDHVVICGLGQKGLILADRYRIVGRRVVVIEADDNNDMINHCKDRGAIVLKGNAADIQLLRKARAHKARQVISVCGDEGINAEIALYTRQLLHKRSGLALACLVHIVDLQIWKSLRERELSIGNADVFRLSFFNVYESGARAMLYKYPPFGADGLPADGGRILIIGLGRMGESLAVNMGRKWKTLTRSGNNRVKLILAGTDALQKQKSISARYPMLETVCNIIPFEIDVNSPDFEKSSFLFNADGQLSLDKIYICLGDETLALRTALKLYQKLRQNRIDIIVRMNRGTGLAALLWDTAEKGKNIASVHTFPLLENTCTPDLIWGGSNYEILAQAMHEDYILKATKRGDTPETNRSMVSWVDLPESLRESNRNQAEHISGKLQRFGYDFVLSEDWEPLVIEFLPEEVEEMSKMEHSRFVEERLRQGWKYGPEKDEASKTSPTLIPWDELSEEEKEKDRNMVRGIPGFLAEAGYSVYRAI